MKGNSTAIVLPSGRTPAEALRECVNFWDQVDRLAPLISIQGGKHDGQTLADVLGSDPEVQADLLALADWLEQNGRKEQNDGLDG